MLFCLMKMNRKLRFQLFLLGLIIGVGVLPSKTVEALRCYKCNSRKDADDFLKDDLCDTRRHKIVEDCSGACLTKTDNYGTGKVVQRQCDSGDDGKWSHMCAHRVFPGGCFLDTVANSAGKMNDCRYEQIVKKYSGQYRSSNEVNTTRENEGGKGRLDLDYLQTLEHCYCDTDLCNGPRGIADGDRPTHDPDDFEDGPHNSGVMTASRDRLIFVGVTVVGVLVAASAASVMSVSNI